MGKKKVELKSILKSVHCLEISGVWVEWRLFYFSVLCTQLQIPLI